MTPMIHRTRGHIVRRASGEARVVVWRTLPQHPTTATERFLLMMTIILLPLESNLPLFGGMSSLFMLFGVLALYMVLCRLRALERTLRHPIFLAGYALVGFGLLMEVMHGSTGFWRIKGFFLMLMGAALIASLCRDRQGLRFGIYGVLLGGVWLSVFLVLTLYTDLSSTNILNYNQATNLRSATIKASAIKNNWNTVAFFAAQGVVVALALGLTTKARFPQYVFLAISVFCTVATFLPMSRSAVIILVVSATVVLYAYGIMRARVLRGAVILVIVTLLWVPEAVFKRFAVSSERHAPTGQYTDGRMTTYSAVIKNLPEYVLTGVGISRFYGDWGMDAGFGSLGTHNIFAEVTVYWGLLGLLALLMLVWQAYQCLPQRPGAEPLSLCLLGVAVAGMVYSFFTHNLENKEFAIALGLLAGSSRWIWPRALTSWNTTQPDLHSFLKPSQVVNWRQRS